MANLPALRHALLDLRALLARPDNDYTWSSWEDAPAALAELDGYLAALDRGAVPDVRILLAPTGPAQEVSLGSGWGDDYLQVAARIETALAGA